MRLEDFPVEVREHIREIAHGPYKRCSYKEAYEKMDVTLPELVGIIRKHLETPIHVGDRVRHLSFVDIFQDCLVIHIDGDDAWIRDEDGDDVVEEVARLQKIEVG